MHSYFLLAVMGRALHGTYFIMAIGLLILTMVAQYRIFEKAGQSGILAFIPIVNVFIMCHIAQVTPWIILLMLVPIVNIFAVLYLEFSYIAAFGFSLGGFLIYLFFGGLMEIYMAFSNDVQYIY